MVHGNETRALELDPKGAMVLAVGWSIFAQRLCAEKAVHHVGFTPDDKLDTDKLHGVFEDIVGEALSSGFPPYLAEKMSAIGLQGAVERCSDVEVIQHNRDVLDDYLAKRKDVDGTTGRLLELDNRDSLEMSHWMYSLRMNWMGRKDLFEVALEELGVKQQELQVWVEQGGSVEELIYGGVGDAQKEAMGSGDTEVMWKYVAMITSLDEPSYELFMGALKQVLNEGMMLSEGGYVMLLTMIFKTMLLAAYWVDDFIW